MSTYRAGLSKWDKRGCEHNHLMVLIGVAVFTGVFTVVLFSERRRCTSLCINLVVHLSHTLFPKKGTSEFPPLTPDLVPALSL